MLAVTKKKTPSLAKTKEDSITKALKQLKAGAMIILVDNFGRENEGDIFMAAEKVSPQHVNFIIKECRGLVCVPLSIQRANELNLGQMVENNEDAYKTKFTVSVDHRETTTGISALERAVTIKALASDAMKASDFKRPGHVFPIVATKSILHRTGHTEAAIEMLREAGMQQVGLICEIIRDDGKMARENDLRRFAEKHLLSMVKIDDLVEHMLLKKKLLDSLWHFSLAGAWGKLKLSLYPGVQENTVLLLFQWDFLNAENKLLFCPALLGDSHSTDLKNLDLDLDFKNKDLQAFLFQLSQQASKFSHAVAAFPILLQTAHNHAENDVSEIPHSKQPAGLENLKYIFENTVENTLLANMDSSLAEINEIIYDFLVSLQGMQSLCFLKKEQPLASSPQEKEKATSLIVQLSAILEKQTKPAEHGTSQKILLYAGDEKSLSDFKRLGLKAEVFLP